MKNLIKAVEITTLHDESIIRWKEQELFIIQEGFFVLVEENHMFNFRLWATEDKARRNDQGYEFVFKAKRKIDYLNQQRNNRMEAMDEWLYNYFNLKDLEDCCIHSETPGMIIDRLSILALKIYHMKIQIDRVDVTNEHQQSCEQKFLTLIAQRKQLAVCLQNFFDEIKARKRTFKIYYQFKMYNDPKLNPELYH